jgi:HEAT repeat protein
MKTMPKAPKLEETLSLLSQVEPNFPSEQAFDILKQVIRSKHAIAVARAAKLVSRLNACALIPELETAFERFMVNATVTDQSCIGKKTIAETLYRLDYSQEDLFLRGIKHVQMESVWGGKADTAPGLRGFCALGLVRMNYPKVMVELADLLADPEPEARIAAARAIAYTEDSQGIPLLRLKIKIGDKDPQVLSECFIALLKLAPDSSLSLVTEFLEHPDAQLCEMAALAIGESRTKEAFPVLSQWWQRSRSPELRRSALLAIAMLRHDEALAFLIRLVAEGKLSEAKDAVDALELYRQDRNLWQRITGAIEKREDLGILYQKQSKSQREG